jgi:hypothetical protein
MKEPTLIGCESMVDPFVIDTPEHPEIGGYRVGEFALIFKPLLIGFKAISGEIQKTDGGFLEEKGE